MLKGKQLTNIRTTSKDEAVRLTPPIRMTLEKALAYIQDDELVEVTPKSIRLRKKLLDENDRKRSRTQQGSRDGLTRAACRRSFDVLYIGGLPKCQIISIRRPRAHARFARRGLHRLFGLGLFGVAQRPLQPRCGQ